MTLSIQHNTQISLTKYLHLYAFCKIEVTHEIMKFTMCNSDFMEKLPEVLFEIIV